MPRGNANSEAPTLTVSPKSPVQYKCSSSPSFPIQEHFHRNGQASFRGKRKNNIAGGNRFSILASLDDTSDSSHRALDITSSGRLSRNRKRGKRGGANSRNGKVPAHFEALNSLFTEMPFLSPTRPPSVQSDLDVGTVPKTRDFTTSPETPSFHTPTRSLSTVTTPATPSPVPKTSPIIPRCSLRDLPRIPRSDPVSPRIRNQARIAQFCLPMPSQNPFTTGTRYFPLAPHPQPRLPASKISKALVQLHRESRFFPSQRTLEKPMGEPKDPYAGQSFFMMGHARHCWCCQEAKSRPELDPAPETKLLHIPDPPVDDTDRRACCTTVDSSLASTVETVPSTPFEVIAAEREDREGWTLLLPEEESSNPVEHPVTATSANSVIPSPPGSPLRNQFDRFRHAMEGVEPKFPWEWGDPEWQWSELTSTGC
ncbi:hypothetical protein EJ05DRAFT_497709 [Pseudovirgaria hyperparasitica]|uniref:Uncharacterized protein n=1 Tax=Pseudovirgaria hyperparasitica TaxID=470096 RepID=A0A6A6WIU2_9PEZI|nr:uncharacterized protein EJ05DRAFT_497709 [Pseudovirgaria hyperparasitica]KAF2761151.1 hypothetical protein EJ05DRAFT_497709 [Pseudovirgaria hyperparasitica]